MGVTGLWTVVAPTARPTKLETLNRKRLAVDASIWIYQFLKAVRDKEGNALRNSHVVGFFRRICKLLYFGIKPVFVFDGGAPVLKRETVRTRARRREGRREDAARTAGKLLAVQVARAAEEDEKARKAQRDRTPVEDELPQDAELVYVDEIGMDQKERQAGRGFRKKDQYHLPDLDVGLEAMGAPDDPRIMSQAELEEYAKQFHSGEDINLYDFNKIDFESPFFLSLPPGDRYNILNAARLRSRLRMGYSKAQLDGMFPDRMAFSRFQIERVKERNELTQRLMHINGMTDQDLDIGGRIAGERGKEYVLVKNDGVEGGWALGVVSNRQGSKKEDAIDLDKEQMSDEEIEQSEEDEFEDVAIEGLNRIPKTWQKKRKEIREVDYDVSYEQAADVIARKRKAVYDARREVARIQSTNQNIAPPKPSKQKAQTDESDSLFVQQDGDIDSDDDDLFEDVNMEEIDNEDDDLQKAIAMSLEQPESGGFTLEDVEQPDGENDDMDLQAALAEARKSKYQTKTNIRHHSPPASTIKTFSGPLPFESLNLGQSLLGKKKAKKVEESLSGGFDREAGSDAFRKERKPQPVPEWFNSAPSTKDLTTNHIIEDEEPDNHDIGLTTKDKLLPKSTKEVIDLDVETAQEVQSFDGYDGDDDLQQDDQVAIEASNRIILENEAREAAERERLAKEREERYAIARQIAADSEPETNNVEALTHNHMEVQKRPTKLDGKFMEDVAEHIQAQPPHPSSIPNFQPAEQDNASEDSATVEWSDSDNDAVVSHHSLPLEDEPAGGEFVGNGSEVEYEDDVFEDVSFNNSRTQVNENASPRDIPHDNDTPLLQDDVVNEQELNAVQQDYMSDSDEELMRQLAIEAEEHARFASSLNTTKTPAEAARDYETELKQLRNQQKKDRRDADEVTQVMIQECQALLRLFGLPYITAPMEAEAQCAELVHLGLVDGIVTDDSDIFLFGGTRIYKNMFNAAKFVECYLSTDLEKEYALTRQKLIRFAHLLGSDYTEGVPGIGPVTALEIISDFGDLQDFKEWCSQVQLGRPQDLDGKLTTSFRRKFKRTVQKRLFLPPSFPDLRVDQAYLQPDVDSDPAEFQWGVPDLEKLRSFLMATIGWSQDRTDEILVPVIRDMNKRDNEGTQANITRFFSGAVGVGANKEGTAPRNRTGKESGRMANAYTRLRGEAEKMRLNDDGTEVPDTNTDHGTKRSRRDTTPVEDENEVEHTVSDKTARSKKSKGGRRRKG